MASHDREDRLGLTPSLAVELDALLDQFEDAMSRGAAPRIEDFLSGREELRRASLKEMLAIELEYRWRSQDPPRIDEYAVRFPDDKADVMLVFEAVEQQVVDTEKGRSTAYTTISEGPADPRRPNPNGLETLGDYQLIEELGHGGMGVVYRARHQKMGRDVALKMLSPALVDSPQSVRRFQREVTAIAAMSHPNIVAAFDAREEGGRHFLVMELVDGIDLQQLVRHRGPLAVESAVECLRQTAEGLRHAHELGVFHRDIKPSNLMLTASEAFAKETTACGDRSTVSRTDGSRGIDSEIACPPSHFTTIPSDAVVKILDLGLARVATAATGKAEENYFRTDEQSTMGTVGFMSPEQSLDAREADHRADIYSLGCTLYFLLTGEPPYRESTAAKTIQAHRDGDIPSLISKRNGVPQQLDVIFQRMLAKSPAERFQSMGELLEALDQFEALSGQTESKQAESVEEDLERKLDGDRSRTRRAIGISIGFVALLALAVILLVTSKGTVRIELAEGIKDDVRIELRQTGQVVVADKSNNWTLKLAGGKWDVSVRGGDDTISVHPDEISVQRFGEKIVQVSLKPSSIPTGNEQSVDDAARQLALWAIEQGGGIHVYGDRPLPNGAKLIRAVEDIPEGPFHILKLQANLGSPTGADESLGRLIAQLQPPKNRPEKMSIDIQHSDADDAFLKAISSNEHIGVLYLDGTAVTDQGIAHLNAMKGLHSISLASSSLTCEKLGPIPQLTTLVINDGPRVGDAAMKRVAEQKKLVKLFVENSRVTDLGVAYLRDLKLLQLVDLNYASGVTDLSCQYLAPLPSLKQLMLEGTGVTDKGVAQLRNSITLETLNLGKLDQVTDACFETLLQLPNLNWLELHGAGVTLHGTAKFQSMRPHCNIYRSDFSPEEIQAEINRLESPGDD